MNNTTFMGMEIALRGLYSSQRGMANVSHNVDNTNTPGYSRQVLNQRAARPMLVANKAGMLGMGSDVVSVERVRDTYLDEKYWSEAQYYGEWSVKTQSLPICRLFTMSLPTVVLQRLSAIFTLYYSNFPPILQAPVSGMLRRKRESWWQNILTAQLPILTTFRRT